MYKKKKNFSPLANDRDRKLEPLPKILCFASEKKNPLLFFTSERLLKQTLPCNTQLQTNILVQRWLPRIDQERFFDLPVMVPLFFLKYFQFSPVDVMLVEGRMLCHSQFVKAFVLRVLLMLSQPCLERTKCLTDVLVVTVLARNFIEGPCFFSTGIESLISCDRLQIHFSARLTTVMFKGVSTLLIYSLTHLTYGKTIASLGSFFFFSSVFPPSFVSFDLLRNSVKRSEQMTSGNHSF